MVICGGSDGIFNAETSENYTDTSVNTIFFESDTQIYTVSSEYQTSGVWTEITDSVPYIKLDSLTITAEKR